MEEIASVVFKVIVIAMTFSYLLAASSYQLRLPLPATGYWLLTHDDRLTTNDYILAALGVLSVFSEFFVLKLN